MKLITRQMYMQNSSELHLMYWGQFVNDKVKADVLSFIGKEALLKSTDEHLNDIPLKKWDALAGFTFRGGEIISRPTFIDPIDIKLIRETGEGVSCAGLVCIYKEAARQLIEAMK